MSALRNLTSLDLEEDLGGTGTSLHVFKHLPALKCLTLECHSCFSLVSGAYLEQLETLQLTWFDMDELPLALMQARRLRTLMLELICSDCCSPGDDPPRGERWVPFCKFMKLLMTVMTKGIVKPIECFLT